MSLRETLAAPSKLSYVASAGPGQPAQVALRDGRGELAAALPPGYQVRVSGAAVNLPHLPWLAVLDRDVTSTAREGLYVAYLFTRDLQHVHLSMNQGVTAHRDYFQKQGKSRPGVAALAELRWESEQLRSRLGSLADNLDSTIELGGEGFFARGYEVGNIASLRYATDNLPTEAELHQDLAQFLALYRETVAARNALVLAHPEHFHTSTNRNEGGDASSPQDPPPRFRPKDASDYVVNVPAQSQRRTRKHEDLIARFGTFVRSRGDVAATNVHPRDLVVQSAGVEYLVEAKTVGNNAEHAVREALGQLFSYRYFYYTCASKPTPVLVALFSEPVGAAFLELLQQISVEAIWWEAGEWRATSAAATLVA